VLGWSVIVTALRRSIRYFPGFHPKNGTMERYRAERTGNDTQRTASALAVGPADKLQFTSIEYIPFYPTEPIQSRIDNW